ncbi:DUF559 domain-containing protein [Nocardioides sp. Kera G14]|uniref:DUF559 domain-containing protein n=1 Tax=Nocardioides sp. Kera G14 TaxID=2884264 RepID=UPI001D10B25D|nr:DUF559 domain-containing protein [Nocardioides sp. Kera G14]UDY23005.1 DUF559 domain-containing protein [Nocardioides sp. Kera G14]
MTRQKLVTTKPFTRTDALRAGISTTELRSSAYRSLHRGIYIAHQIPTTPLIAAAAALAAIGKPGFASHSTAARLWGLPIPMLPDEHVTVGALKHRRQRPGVRCHHTKGRPRVKLKDGVYVSSPEQTFVEMATLLPLVDLVVVGDHIVKKGLSTLGRLRAYCQKAKGPGATAARAAATYVRNGVESPMETRTRMLIVLAGLPEPEVNQEQLVAGVRRRFDLSWRGVKVIVEYDGRHHIEREQQWVADLRRREEIEADGWTMLVLVSADIYGTPAATLERVATALVAAGLLRDGHTVANTWRAHFSERAAA